MLIDIRNQLDKLEYFIRTYGIETHSEIFGSPQQQEVFFITVSRTDTDTIKSLIQKKIYPKLYTIFKKSGPSTTSDLELDWLSVDHSTGKTVLQLLVSREIAEKFDLASAKNFFQEHLGKKSEIQAVQNTSYTEYQNILIKIQNYQRELKNHYHTQFKEFYTKRLESHYMQKWNSLALSLLREKIHRTTKKSQAGGSLKMEPEYVDFDGKSKFKYYRNLAKQVVFRPNIEEDHRGLSVKFSKDGKESSGIVVKNVDDGYEILAPSEGDGLKTFTIKSSEIKTIYQPMDNFIYSLNQVAFDGMMDDSAISPVRNVISSLLEDYLAKYPDSALTKTIQLDPLQFHQDLKEAFAR